MVAINMIAMYISLPELHIPILIICTWFTWSQNVDLVAMHFVTKNKYFDIHVIPLHMVTKVACSYMVAMHMAFHCYLCWYGCYAILSPKYRFLYCCYAHGNTGYIFLYGRYAHCWLDYTILIWLLWKPVAMDHRCCKGCCKACNCCRVMCCGGRDCGRRRR